MSQITTHILDLSLGMPARGVAAILYRGTGADRTELGQGVTDTDGRISRWLGDETLPGGTYSIIFASGRYFADRGVDTFYPHVEIVFGVAEGGVHYHVPLLLSPWGYSTYRGS